MDKIAKNKSQKDKIIVIISIILIIASLSYDGYVFWNLRKENISLKEQLAVFDNALKISQKNFQKTSGEKDAVTTLLTDRKSTRRTA